VVRDKNLTGPKGGQRARVRRGDWLVTDGYWVGRFDKDNLDWYPLEWVRNNPIVLDENVVPVLEAAVAKVPVSKLKSDFEKLVFIEPGELTPEMPLPSLNQLGTYLRARRTMSAHTTAPTYDRR